MGLLLIKPAELLLFLTGADRAGILPGFSPHLACPPERLRASGQHGNKVFPGGHDPRHNLNSLL
jgi:hypothetical protein